MSETGKFQDKTGGTNFMGQMQKFKAEGAVVDPAKNPATKEGQAAAAAVAAPAPPKPNVDPTNPNPAAPPPEPQMDPAPKEGAQNFEGYEYKGVVNRPVNAPLPPKDGAKAPEAPEAKPAEGAAKPEEKPVEGAAKPPESPEAPAAKPADTPAEPAQLTDEAVAKYLSDKYKKEIQLKEDLFQAPEPAQIDPFEGLNDDVAGFVKYHKETGRTYDEYLSLNKDWDTMSPLDVARQQAIEKSGGVLNSSNVDEYLEGKLGIDDLNDLSVTNKAELNIYNADFINQKKSEREKYSQPIERPQKKDNVDSMEGMVKLENGTIMPKEQYDNIVKSQQAYRESLRKAADKITPSKFTVEFDDNGTKIPFEVDYDPSQNERTAMLSDAGDVISAFEKDFKGQDGEVDLVGLQEAMFWKNPKNREKAITAMVHKALAQFAEHIARRKNNPNYTQNRMPASANAQTSNSNPFIAPTQSSGIKFPKELFKR